LVKSHFDKLNNTDSLKCDGHFNMYFKMQRTLCIPLLRSFEDTSLLHYCRENQKPCHDQLVKETRKNQRFSEDPAMPTLYYK